MKLSSFIDKKKMKFGIVIILISLLFPTLITLTFSGKSGRIIHDGFDSGLYVLVEKNGYREKIDSELYITLCIANQLNINNPDELIKAFAVVLRTYIYKETNGNSTIYAKDLNLEHTELASLKKIWGNSFDLNYKRLRDLVSATSHQTIKKDNKYISPYYHSFSAGQTRNGTEGLGEEYTYLSIVSCPEDTTVDNYSNTYYFSVNDFASRLRLLGSDLYLDPNSPLEALQIVSRDSAGYILTLSVAGKIINASAFADAFELPSPYFMIEEIDGQIRISTYGMGHGYGLSLNAASNMAKNGSTYLEILNKFYNGVIVN